MNIADIVLLIIIAIELIIGYKNGILLSIISLCRFFVSIPISYFVSSKYDNFIYDTYVKQRIADKLTEKISSSNSIDTFISELPKSITSLMDMSLIKDFDASKLADYLTNNIISPVALVVVQIILFIITFIVIGLLFGIVECIIKSIRKKKDAPLKKTGSLLGVLFALIKSFAILLVVGAFAEFITSITNADNSFVNQLNNSVILNYINEYNPLKNL